MNITKQEIRTIYSIEIEFTDFTKIFMDAKDDVTRLSSEFKDFDLEDTTVGNISKCFDRFNAMCRENQSKDLQYIVRKLGFDGIENYGYMKKRMDGKKVYRMSVYNYGQVNL